MLYAVTVCTDVIRVILITSIKLSVEVSWKMHQQFTIRLFPNPLDKTLSTQNEANVP
jgi:hypothetical protein